MIEIYLLVLVNVVVLATIGFVSLELLNAIVKSFSENE